MKYPNIYPGSFIDRPNRFIAYVKCAGRTETVHVKNTGRCAELLQPEVPVYIQKSDNPERKTGWDLIAVEKGDRLINMDSQAPNKVAQEWLCAGGLVPDPVLVKPEYTYENSRFDFYVETKNQKILVEVKGVTLEEDGVVRFPDAPSERAVKHVQELKKARKAGYEAYVLFVIQMKGVRYFTPNRQTHPEFAEALQEAADAGVKILARDCVVTTDSMTLADEVPVVLGQPELHEMAEPLTGWYRKYHRDLPWRHHPDPYRIWISEIMLQQTRVEAVKGYYDRFLQALPTVKDLAEAPEDKLLKLWEGLGYYNRVRNMQKAAIQIMEEYGGEFPADYEKILELKGIGSYTAGAISSFAFGIPKPAVDGNVLRVVTRVLADDADIMKQSTKKRLEKAIEEVIPADAASDFNQGLIELGAIVCVPNGEPKCGECPLKNICRAEKEGLTDKLPVKKKAKARRIEKKTVFLFEDLQEIAIRKRPAKGLLAGLYELPNVEGHLTRKEAENYCRSIGLMPVRIKKLPDAKHIFSHVEWQMKGYQIQVDELEKTNEKGFLFIHPGEIREKYSIPSAFAAYTKDIL